MFPLIGEVKVVCGSSCCETGYGYSVRCVSKLTTLSGEENFHVACAALDTSELNGLLLTVIARVGMSVSTDVGAKSKKFALGTVTGSTLDL